MKLQSVAECTAQSIIHQMDSFNITSIFYKIRAYLAFSCFILADT